MATIEEIVNLLDTLDAQNLEFVADFVRYLQWKQGAASPAADGRPWVFDFVEHFRRAMIGADADPAGMEVRVGEATCGGETRMALWQHPPVQGAAFVEYPVPVPAGVSDLRLRFATGIRDGSHLTAGNVVAFRVFVNDWKIWSDTQHAQQWKEHEIAMPTLPGDVARIRFVTDGLGNHEWAWAVWGEPRLTGGIADPN